jgi:hypothetical protein
MTRKSFGLLATVMCLALLALPISRVQAAGSEAIAVTVTITQELSVSLNQTLWDVGGGVSEGTIHATTDLNPGWFIAENAGNAPVDLTTTVSCDTGWIPDSETGAADHFVMNQSTDGGSTWVGIGAEPIASSLAPTVTQSFDLQLLVPTSTTQGGVPQTITVTVTASAS